MEHSNGKLDLSCSAVVVLFRLICFTFKNERIVKLDVANREDIVMIPSSIFEFQAHGAKGVRKMVANAKYDQLISAGRGVNSSPLSSVSIDSKS